MPPAPPAPPPLLSGKVMMFCHRPATLGLSTLRDQMRQLGRSQVLSPTKNCQASALTIYAHSFGEKASPVLLPCSCMINLCFCLVLMPAPFPFACRLGHKSHGVELPAAPSIIPPHPRRSKSEILVVQGILEVLPSRPRSAVKDSSLS